MYLYHSQLPISSSMIIFFYRSTSIPIITMAILIVIIINIYTLSTISIIMYLYHPQLPISSSMNIHFHRSTSILIITTGDGFFTCNNSHDSGRRYNLGSLDVWQGVRVILYVIMAGGMD